MHNQKTLVDHSLNRYVVISVAWHTFGLIIFIILFMILKDSVEKIRETNMKLVEKSVTVDIVTLPKATKEPLQAGTIDAPENQIVKKAEPNKGPKDVIVDHVVDTTAKISNNKKLSSATKKAGTARIAGGTKKTGAPKIAGLAKSAKVAETSGGAKVTQGTVDYYKPNDLANSLSGVLAKTGSLENVSTRKNDAISGEGDTLAGGGGDTPGGAGGGATLKTAKLEHQSGSVSGLAGGKLDSTRGMGGIVTKGSFFTAEIPNRTVVLGGMDPATIRERLLEYLPQFRFCYQKVLDRTQTGYSGVVNLSFIIGPSGRVLSANAAATTGNMPDEVRDCVVNVLRGIPFPSPPSGGKVEVSQPVNFYPKTK